MHLSVTPMSVDTGHELIHRLGNKAFLKGAAIYMIKGRFLGLGDSLWSRALAALVEGSSSNESDAVCWPQ